jgi:hypothetical protein
VTALRSQRRPHGDERAHQDRLWLPFTAEQTADSRSFAWRARFGWGPLTPLRATDRYADAAGSTDSRLLGRVTLFTPTTSTRPFDTRATRPSSAPRSTRSRQRSKRSQRPCAGPPRWAPMGVGPCVGGRRRCCNQRDLESLPRADFRRRHTRQRCGRRSRPRRRPVLVAARRRWPDLARTSSHSPFHSGKSATLDPRRQPGAMGVDRGLRHRRSRQIEIGRRRHSGPRRRLGGSLD